VERCSLQEQDGEAALFHPLTSRETMATEMVARGKPADYGQEILKRRARIVSTVMPLSGRHVLDFGAGNGAQTLELVKQGCKIAACDIDQDDLDTLSRHIQEHRIEGVTPVRYDGTTLPFPDGHFDLVVSFAVLEHVQDEAKALSEIHRVLKQRGELLIAVPNKWWIFETHGARLPVLSWNRVPFFSWLPKALHSRFANARIYRKKEIISKLKATGFEIVESFYMTAPMDMVKSLSVQKLLRSVIFRGDRSKVPFLSTEIFVHGCKV
jgi:ubiquinone/menaquinone biosynthesis C-methylase UbiE